LVGGLVVACAALAVALVRSTRRVRALEARAAEAEAQPPAPPAAPPGGSEPATSPDPSSVVANERRLETARTGASHADAGADPTGDPGADPTGVLADFAAAARAASLTDPLTGLFNEQFFLVTLESRISAARRHLRPVAVALLDVAEGVRDGNPEPLDPVLVANGLRTTLREADTACRLSDGRFALVLEDTPENGAVWTVERLRRHLVSMHEHQTLWAGVACYPAHAFDASEILERAAAALAAAKEWQQDRIEVATTDN
jgi:two-component system cell cycle response regulator